MDSTSLRSSPGLRRFAGGVTLLMIPVALFLPHLDGAFYWDDIHLVRDHPLLRAPDGYWRVFTTELLEGAGYPKTQFYHPIPLLSLWLQYLVSDSIAWLRFANVLFHGLNVLLFARVLERTGLRRPTIFFCAVAFAVHPLAVEPVMLICGRHDTIATSLALLALCSQPFDALAQPQAQTRAVAVWCVAVGSFVLLAFISKEALVAAGPVATVFMALSWRLGENRRSLAYLCAAPFLGLLGAFGIRTALAISASSAQASASLRTHATNLGTILGEYSRYILTFSHGTTTRVFAPYELGGATFVLTLVAGALFVAGYASRRPLRERSGWTPATRVLFGLMWAVLGVGPHILSLPMIGMWGNRYGYFPSMGLLLCLGAISEVALKRAPPRVRIAIGAAATLLALRVASQTELLARTWHDGVSLFAADVTAEPENPLAHYHLGVETERLYGCARALGSFEEAARLAPTYWRTVHNTAGCLIRVQRYTEAIRPAKRAVNLAPANRASRENLAIAQLRGGNRDTARATIERGLLEFPESRVLRELEREAAELPPE